MLSHRVLLKSFPWTWAPTQISSSWLLWIMAVGIPAWSISNHPQNHSFTVRHLLCIRSPGIINSGEFVTSLRHRISHSRMGEQRLRSNRWRKSSAGRGTPSSAVSTKKHGHVLLSSTGTHLVSRGSLQHSGCSVTHYKTWCQLIAGRLHRSGSDKQTKLRDVKKRPRNALKRDTIGRSVPFLSSKLEPEWRFRTPKRSFGIATEPSWILGGTKITSRVWIQAEC